MVAGHRQAGRSPDRADVQGSWLAKPSAEFQARFAFGSRVLFALIDYFAFVVVSIRTAPGALLMRSIGHRVGFVASKLQSAYAYLDLS